MHQSINKSGVREIPRHKFTSQVLKQTACGLFFSALIGIIFKKPVFGAALFVLSTVILALGLCVPYTSEKYFKKLIDFTAKILSWILLAPCFYLICIPARIITYIKSYDPLERALSTDRETYWELIPGVALSQDNVMRQY